MASESDDEGFLRGAGSANKGLFADVLATPRGEDPRTKESVEAWLALFGNGFKEKYAARCIAAGP